MLQEIHIENYAVIDRLCIEFSPGLNLLSGETGSGKSILVDALGLALGGRASAEVLRAGSDKTTVTAVFQVASKAALAGWRQEYGFEAREEEEIILRREIQPSGKSRLLLNDRPATVAAVRALAPLLVEVHGQGEHAALFDRQTQLGLLDRFAPADDLLEEVGELHARRRSIEEQIAKLTQDEQERLRTLDLLAFQVRELEEARLEPGEDARLEEEKRVLAHLEKIRAAAASAYAALYEDDRSATAQLALVARALEEFRRYDASIEPYLAALGEAKGRAEEIAFFLRDYRQDLDDRPGRLEEVEDRLALLDRLKRKYGKTLDEVLAYRDRSKLQLADLENAAQRRSELQPQLEGAVGEYRRAAEALSAHRRTAARQLEKAVREELAGLGMEKTRFEIQFENEAPTGSGALGGPRGMDSVEFMISPNPGEDLRPLEATASGGELSRFMLALRTVAGSARSRAGNLNNPAAPTFVFDEVDAGIGGRVAEQVGRRLKRLASESQVLCVTHLAQIACFADRHFHVEKAVRGGRTVTRVKALETPGDRASELARMLSGSQITPEVLRHAATMLERAAQAGR
jgi:DNA repair protein RecN (Recombination protein N)